MKLTHVKVVRIYLSEGEGRLDLILRELKEISPSRGATVFRAIAGFGPSGHTHDASITDLSLDLPLVVEFFDEPERVDQILAKLENNLKAEHVLMWSAEMMV